MSRMVTLVLLHVASVLERTNTALVGDAVISPTIVRMD